MPVLGSWASDQTCSACSLASWRASPLAGSMTYTRPPGVEPAIKRAVGTHRQRGHPGHADVRQPPGGRRARAVAQLDGEHPALIAGAEVGGLAVRAGRGAPDEGGLERDAGGPQPGHHLAGGQDDAGGGLALLEILGGGLSKRLGSTGGQQAGRKQDCAGESQARAPGSGHCRTMLPEGTRRASGWPLFAYPAVDMHCVKTLRPDMCTRAGQGLVAPGNRARLAGDGAGSARVCVSPATQRRAVATPSCSAESEAMAPDLHILAPHEARTKTIGRLVARISRQSGASGRRASGCRRLQGPSTRATICGRTRPPRSSPGKAWRS